MFLPLALHEACYRASYCAFQLVDHMSKTHRATASGCARF